MNGIRVGDGCRRCVRIRNATILGGMKPRQCQNKCHRLSRKLSWPQNSFRNILLSTDEREINSPMSDQSLERIEAAGAVARTDIDIESLFRAAMERGPEIVERMMAVRRELNAEAARAAFDEAMAALQAEMPVIGKCKGVFVDGKKAYAFTPFEVLVATLKPLLERHRFSFALGTDTESKDGWVIASCTITHRAGHSRTSTAKFPLGDGTRLMSKTQVYAAALTFASRRVFCNAFGIVTAGEDVDGAGQRPKPRSPADPEPAKPTDLRCPQGQARGESPISSETRPGGAPGESAPLNTEAARKDAARKLWNLVEPVRGPERNWEQAEEWLREFKIIGDLDVIVQMTVEQLEQIYNKSSIQLDEIGGNTA